MVGSNRPQATRKPLLHLWGFPALQHHTEEAVIGYVVVNVPQFLANVRNDSLSSVLGFGPYVSSARQLIEWPEWNAVPAFLSRSCWSLSEPC